MTVHEVVLHQESSAVGSKDIKIRISTAEGGKLGVLLGSQGNLEWLPRAQRGRK